MLITHNKVADRMVTSGAVAGCFIRRAANSKFGFFQLPNVIDWKSFREIEGNCGWQELIERI